MSVKKMRLTVAHNNKTDLTPELAKLGSVESVYGKMARDIVGGGRSTYLLSDVNIDGFKGLIDQAHEHHMKYIYLLNSPCLSNMETTRKYNDEFYEFIGKLMDMGVNGFVVAMPYVLDFIKCHFPKATVSISTFAQINSITKAKAWEDKGADRLIVYQDCNRDFTMLSKIRKAVSCELELFANNLCVDQCPFPSFHSNFNAHSGNTKDKTGGFALDYCGMQCTKTRLKNPVEFIRGRFIRPEDLHLYEEIGIDVFKLADRVKSTDWITNVATAYSNRRYDGNLADLIGYPFFRKNDGETVGNNPIGWMLRPDYIGMDFLKELSRLGDAKQIVYIDNRKLDGFCEFFKKHDCRTTICDVECHHCQKYTDKAVTINTEAAAEKVAQHQKVLDMMVDRSAYKPEPLLKQVIIKTAVKAGLIGPKKKKKPSDSSGKTPSLVKGES